MSTFKADLGGTYTVLPRTDTEREALVPDALHHLQGRWGQYLTTIVPTGKDYPVTANGQGWFKCRAMWEITEPTFADDGKGGTILGERTVVTRGWLFHAGR